MASASLLCHALLLLALLANSSARSVHAGVPAYRTTPSLDDLIGTLSAAGEFNLWAGILLSANLSSLPPAATLFAPTDLAVSRAVAVDLDLALVLYHISPEALPFARLQLFGPGAHIPTLLPNASILITENTTLDGAPVTQPDLFFDGMVAIHGVGSILSLPSDSGGAQGKGGAAGSAGPASAAHGLSAGVAFLGSVLAFAVLGLKVFLGAFRSWSSLLV